MRPINRLLLLVVLTVSVATAALAAAWLTGAVSVPLVAPDDALALLLLPPAGLAWLVLGAALVGAGSALLLARVRPERVLLPAAAVQLAVFAFAVQGLATIALAGYLFALLLPAALVLLAVQVVRRYPRLRAVVALAVLAVGLWGATTGTFRPDQLRQLGRNLAGGFAGAAAELVAALLFTALALGWALLVLDALRGTAAADRMGAIVIRHRRGITLVAALGPVPYVLARATWLTPWPQFAGPIEDLSPAVRLWGLLLGGAALLGTVLTLGLIQRWGEVFPRWMPGLAGRPVPVRAAAVPGGLVAAVVSVSAVPMLVAMLTSDLTAVDKALSVLIFPFGIWGPALALAVWGYVGHRRRDGHREPVGGPSTSSSRIAAG